MISEFAAVQPPAPVAVTVHAPCRFDVVAGAGVHGETPETA